MECRQRGRRLNAPAPGSIGWIDLTVEDAPRLRDFYSAVVGWKPEDVPTEEYSDWVMALAGEILAGPKAMGTDRYAVLRDPAGAAFALWQKGA